MVYLAVPDNFKLPEGVEENEAFQELVTLRLKDGQLCLEDLNGVEPVLAQKQKSQKQTDSFKEAFSQEMGY